MDGQHPVSIQTPTAQGKRGGEEGTLP